jgi:hypothetical protein
MSCTRIEVSAFFGSGLKQVTIPVGCAIGEAAFQKCGSLTTVTVGIGCPKFERFAFEYCKALTFVAIGTGCTKIGHRAFHGCVALAAVTLPLTVKSLGYCTFGKCPALSTIAIPKGCLVHKETFSGSGTRVTEV